MNEVNSKKQIKMDKLWDKGLEAIKNEEFDKAINIGRSLKKLRHTSAFEVLALAYNGKRKTIRAIKILKQGVKKGPNAWPLWQLLGNYYSDIGKFNRCFKAYENGLKCPNADTTSLHINYAVASSRINNNEEALLHLEFVTTTEDAMYFRSEALKSEIYNELGLYEQSLDISKRNISKNEEDPTKYEDIRGIDISLSTLLRESAYALWKLNSDIDMAYNHLQTSLLYDKLNPRTAWIIREINNEFAADSKYYRVLIEGEWYPPEPNEDEYNFFTSYDVVASTEEEALEYIKFFEPDELKDSIKIHETEVLEKNIKDNKGVYETNGYNLYPRKDKE